MHFRKILALGAMVTSATISFTRIAPDANGRIVLYVSSSPAPSSLYAPINVFQFEKIADAATLITIQ